MIPLAPSVEIAQADTLFLQCTVTMGNLSVQVRGNAVTGPWRPRPKWGERKARIYVYGWDDVDYSDLMAIQGWTTDESLTPEFKRRNRIEIQNMRQLMKDAGPLLAALGLPATVKASFSKQAGCSCGCSPGFISEDYLTILKDGRWYTITELTITRKDEAHA